MLSWSMQAKQKELPTVIGLILSTSNYETAMKPIPMTNTMHCYKAESQDVCSSNDREIFPPLEWRKKNFLLLQILR